MNHKKAYFNPLWLSNPNFHWAEPAKDKTFCYCKYCKKNFDLSNMGKSALVSHQAGKKHKKLVEISLIEIKSESNTAQTNDKENSLPSGNTETINGQLTPTNSQSEAASMSSNDAVDVPSKFEDCADVKATLVWCLTTVYNRMPITSSVDLLQVARLAFPDSQILHTTPKLEPTELSYMIVHVLAPYIREKLVKCVKSCDEYSLAFDESFNNTSKTKQLDVFVRFWDNVEDKACSRYLTSVFLPHSQSDVLSGIRGFLIDFDLQKLNQISIDAPNVDKSVFKDLQTHLLAIEPNFHGLLDVETCGLHTLNNVFQSSIEETKWDLVSFLRVCYHTFHKSAERRDDYVRLNNSNSFPEKYSEVHWLDNRLAAEKILKIHAHLKEFCEFYKYLEEEHTIPNFEFMYDCLQDPLLEAKLNFFINICKELEEFSTLYQTEKPMVPFFYSDLKSMIESLMGRFIDSEEELSTDPLIDVDIENDENIMDTQDIFLGFVTRWALKSSKASEEEILTFENDCLKSLKLLVSRLMKTFPIKNELLKSLSFCNPAVIHNSRDVSESRFTDCLEVFFDKALISGTQADKAQNEFRRLLSDPVVLDRCKHFDKHEDRLDTFWVQLVQSRGSAYGKFHLLTVFRKIFVMFHGNADIKRGFSVNKHCSIVNQSSESLIAQRLVYDAVQRAGGVGEFEINEDVIKAAIDARENYQMHLELENLGRENSVEEYQKRKRKAELLSVLEKKRQRLEKEKAELQIEIDLLENS